MPIFIPLRGCHRAICAQAQRQQHQDRQRRCVRLQATGHRTQRKRGPLPWSASHHTMIDASESCTDSVSAAQTGLAVAEPWATPIRAATAQTAHARVSSRRFQSSSRCSTPSTCCLNPSLPRRTKDEKQVQLCCDAGIRPNAAPRHNRNHTSRRGPGTRHCTAPPRCWCAVTTLHPPPLPQAEA